MNYIGTGLKGMAMGIAEAIPGVSGGTIAFITGIYERLINAIKSVDGGALKLLVQFKLGAFVKKIDGLFLVALAVGMAAGILLSVVVITELIHTYPEHLWAFFFGLILASAVYIGRQIEKWNASNIALLIIGTIIAYVVCTLSPVSGSTNSFYLILCGAIAISALILPGISGSFILLILGMYTTVISSVRGLLDGFAIEHLRILSMFAIGCIIGLVVFSRVISWAYEKYKEPLLALLTGFIIGSLTKIWPWRNPVLLLNDEGETLQSIPEYSHEALESFKILKEQLVLPSDYLLPQVNIFLVLGCFVAGMACVVLLSRFDKATA